LETAIKVCRQAGYHEHAVYLAKLGEEHNLYVLFNKKFSMSIEGIIINIIYDIQIPENTD
jgi:hypothetical protein